MKKWNIVFTKWAQKDARKISNAKLRPKVEKLLELLKEDPSKTSPHYEKLIGDLAGCDSRRINIQHRLVYEVHAKERVVKVLRMWTHYE